MHWHAGRLVSDITTEQFCTLPPEELDRLLKAEEIDRERLAGKTPDPDFDFDKELVALGTHDRRFWDRAEHHGHRRPKWKDPQTEFAKGWFLGLAMGAIGVLLALADWAGII